MLGSKVHSIGACPIPRHFARIRLLWAPRTLRRSAEYARGGKPFVACNVWIRSRSLVVPSQLNHRRGTCYLLLPGLRAWIRGADEKRREDWNPDAFVAGGGADVRSRRRAALDGETDATGLAPDEGGWV